MNKIKAKIKNIRTNGVTALLRLESLNDKSHIFSALMLNYDDRLRENLECSVVFKESEVMICAKDYDKISARNRFVSQIKAIEKDSIFARISFAFEDSTITSLISSDAAEDLELKIGENFAWFIKSNEVMLEF